SHVGSGQKQSWRQAPRASAVDPALRCSMREIGGWSECLTLMRAVLDTLSQVPLNLGLPRQSERLLPGLSQKPRPRRFPAQIPCAEKRVSDRSISDVCHVRTSFETDSDLLRRIEETWPPQSMSEAHESLALERRAAATRRRVAPRRCRD